MKKTRNLAIITFCVLILCGIGAMNAFAYDVDGVLLKEVSGEDTYKYFISQGEAVIYRANVKGDVTVPDTLGDYKVKAIFESAFYDNTELTAVTVPGSIKTVGDNAFSGCYKLERVILGEGVKTVGDAAFNTYYCEDSDIEYPSSLREVVLPDSIEYIGEAAFNDSKIEGELRLPESLRVIGNSAFAYADISCVIIGEEVSEIGSNAFMHCNKLEKFIVSENNKHYLSDGDGVLFNKDKTVIVQYPSVTEKAVYEIPETVEVVGSSCFYSCRGLEEIIIPATVTEIEDFAICHGGEVRVVIPLSVKKIGQLFFDSKNIYYEGTREDWAKLDEKCYASVEEMIHFDSVGTQHDSEIKNIGATCLTPGRKIYSCTCGIKQETVTDRRLTGHGEPTAVVVNKATPESNGTVNKVCTICGVVDTISLEKIEIAQIKSDVYDGKSKKPSVTVKNSEGKGINASYYDVSYDGTPKEIGVYPVTVTFKGEYYQGTITAEYIITPAMPSKSEISFKGDEISLSWSRVSGATGYRVYIYDNNGKYPKLLEDTSEISYTAKTDYYGKIFGCGKYIFSVEPYTVLENGREIAGKYHIEKSITRSITEYTQNVDGVSYRYYIYGKAAVISGFNGSGNIAIPEKLGGYKVRYIGTDAFRKSDVTSVIIPEGVESIGTRAFMESKIEELTLPSTLSTIENNALEQCSRLNKISVSEDSEVFSCDENGVLFNKDKTILICYPANNKAQAYRVPSTVVTIAEQAFSSADLISIELPDSLEAIGECAFENMVYLEAISFGAGLRKIGGYAFMGCTSLKSIVISEGVEEIASGAFRHCNKLERVILPESLVSLGKNVFEYCPVNITGYCGTQEQWNKIEGIDNYAFQTLHYRWNEFEAHSFEKIYEQAADCTHQGRIDYVCVCGAEKTKTTNAPEHVNINCLLLKATDKEGGICINECRKCGKLQRTYIYKAEIKLSADTLVFNGKVRKPGYSVKSYITELRENIDYTVIYPDGESKKIGKYRIRFVSTEDSLYSFDITEEYSVVPAGTEKINVKSGKNTIKLTWEKVKNATGYRVYKYDSSTKKWVKLTSTKSLSYTAKKLGEGTEYKFYVRAYTKLSDGTVIWSNQKVKRICSTTPAEPASFKVSSTQKGMVTLSWGDAVGADGYTVFYATSKNGKYRKLTGSDTDSDRSFNVTGLKSGKIYYFKVRAYTLASPENLRSSYTAIKSVKIK